MALSLLFKGFNYTSNYTGNYRTGDTYAQMVATGVGSVALTAHYGINVGTSGVFRSLTALPDNDIGTDVGFTETDANLNSQTRSSVAAGQTVMVRPLIDFLPPSVTGIPIAPYPEDAWRQYYKPANIGAFFNGSRADSYTSLIVDRAKAAQAAGAQLFDIGTELDGLVTTKTAGYWTRLITNVRAVFHGQLTYSANWAEGGTGASISTIPLTFWRQLDYIGVDAYVPASRPGNLTSIWNQVSTDPEVAAAFKGMSAIDYLESVATAAGKPLILTEVGYTDASNAATNPENQNGRPDAAQQAALYKAFFDAWGSAGPTALVGAYFYNWNPGSSDGGITSTDFTPQHNPAALSEVTAGFSGPSPYVVTLTAGTRVIGTAISDTGQGARELIVSPYTRSNGDGSNAIKGRVTLSGPNTYSGGTLIIGGTITLGSAQALGTGGLDLLAGQLNLSGYALTLPTLRGGGSIVASRGTTAGPNVLTVASGRFLGTLSNGGIGNTLQLVKTGTGTLVLSGRNAYATTRIDGGTLEIDEAASAGGSAISFNGSGAQLTIANEALQGSRNVAGLGHVFSSALAGFGRGESINLGGFGGITNATATFAKGVYNVTLTGTGVTGGKVTLQFAAAYTYAGGLGAFSIRDDGEGGTIITVTRDPVATAVTLGDFVGARSLYVRIAGGVAIADTAKSIGSNLGALATDISHITSITATGGPVTATMASFTRYRTTLDKVTSGYAIADKAANIQAKLDALQNDIGQITSLSFTNAAAPVLRLSEAQYNRDVGILDKIVGPFTTIVAHPDGSTTTTRHNQPFAAASRFDQSALAVDSTPNPGASDLGAALHDAWSGGAGTMTTTALTDTQATASLTASPFAKALRDPIS